MTITVTIITLALAALALAYVLSKGTKGTTLLNTKGDISEDEIAKAVLEEHKSELSYYTDLIAAHEREQAAIADLHARYPEIRETEEAIKAAQARYLELWDGNRAFEPWCMTQKSTQ